MQSLKFYNSKNEEFKIEYTKPYLLQNLIGLSHTPLDTMSSRGYMQDGQTATEQLLQARNITFSVVIMGDSLQEVFENRRKLISFLRPKEKFIVIYTNNHLQVKFECRVNTMPSFDSTQSRQGQEQYSVVGLICDNPYLMDTFETTREMAISVPLFSFPMSFTPTVVFSASAQTIYIDNTGDVETPVKILFYGPSTNPEIKNVTSNETIRVQKVLAENEYLEITTGYGNKKVIYHKADGSIENAFNFIDVDTEFWSLQTGINEIQYSSDSGAESANVYLTYVKRYVGV